MCKQSEVHIKLRSFTNEPY